jgi:streptogramin lyase
MTAVPVGASVEGGGPYSLAVGTRAKAMAPGADGNLWFTRAAPGGAPAVAVGVGRITPRGEIVEYPVPSFPWDYRIGGIAAGPDGALWFAETGRGMIGRVTLGGQVTSFPLPAGVAEPGAIAAGPDGALWFTANADQIGRIETDGDVTVFSLAPGSRPTGIAAGPDGALWITEAGTSKIARMTTGGAVTEFALPRPTRQPMAIVAGPDGRMWFTEAGAPRIGRIGMDGAVEELRVPSKRGTESIVSGPGEILWFTTGGAIGSISTDGATGEPICVEESTCRTPVAALAIGPEGALWYATGLRKISGGGGTQLANALRPGTIGRVSAPRLRVRIGPRAGPVRGRWTTVQLGCRGGVAGQACAGVLRLTARVRRNARGRGWRTAMLARRHYRLLPTQDRRLAIRLRRPAVNLLSRRGRLTASASAMLAGPEARRTLVLRLARPR